jgi:FkbM family methyltransferase
LVTASDIEACYRLLLGRPPDPDGLDYWQSAVDRMRVADLVGAFVDSREFHVSPLCRRLLESVDLPQRTEGRLPILVDLCDRVQFVDPGDSFVGQAIAETRSYEPHLSQAIVDVLRPGDTFVDVGANVGWFALLAAARVGPSGQVLAIEADAANVELLCRSAHQNGFTNLLALPVAASDRAGLLVLQRLGGSNGAVFALAGQTAPGDRYVPGVPLDGLSGLLHRLDVMKVDVEGAELMVLRGAAELVRQHRPHLFFEYSPGMLARLPGSSVGELDQWIHGLGYQIEIVPFDGPHRPVASLEEASRYLTEHSHGHIDLKASPSERK